MTHDSPSTKQRRVSGTRLSSLVVIVGPGESPELAHGQEKFTHHADFWLDDGNLILFAGHTAFRVYKGLLTKNSAVFLDVFATGSADASETFDGCPVICLPEHPADLADFLQYLMPCAKLRLCDGLPVSDFSELHAAVHLAREYQRPDVEARGLFVLKRSYPPSFTDHVQFDPSKASLISAQPSTRRRPRLPSIFPFRVALYEASSWLRDKLIGPRASWLFAFLPVATITRTKHRQQSPS